MQYKIKPLAALAVIMALSVPVFGQQAKSVGSTDAVIIAEPSGNQARLAIIFDKHVPAGQIKDRLANLAHAGGWSYSTPEINEEEMFAPSDSGKPQSLGKSTGVTTILSNAPQIKGAGFNLQPYIQAFKDLNQFEILFNMQEDKRFQGLKEFDNPVVSITLVRSGGPYRYHVVIRDHSAPLPKLPITQASPQVSSIQASPVRTHPSGSAFGLVIVIAAASGLLVLLTLRLLSLQRASKHKIKARPGQRTAQLYRPREPYAPRRKD
jgi:hypothetical protein